MTPVPPRSEERLMSSLVALALLTPVCPGAAPPTAGPAALVRQLGSDLYADRLAAERGLLVLGVRAIPALEVGGEDADLEVRRRCRSLLKKLRAEQCAQRLRAMRGGRLDGGFTLWDHYR